MARFKLVADVVGAPPGHAYGVFPAGTTIADTAGNALAGDTVWAALCWAPSPLNMTPLDDEARALMPGPLASP